MILYCENCKEYTLETKCKKCGGKTLSNKPARFKKEKNYAMQRLKVKGLL